MPGAVLACAVGLVLLLVASERFVQGAAGIALRLRLAPVVVGAVIVGFGTSAPELLVSGLAAVNDSRDIGVGNIVGSNLANITLVLGAVALVAPPMVDSRVLRREVPLMVLGLVALALLLRPLTVGGGLALLLLFGVSMIVIVRSGLADRDDPLAAEVTHELEDEARLPWSTLAAFTVGGLLGTLAGAHLLVTGATSIADRLELGEGLVGFTLVALGTSLPELFTSIQAARHGEPDLAVGNVLGSNLFNSLLIGGTVAVVSPGPVAEGLLDASWVMVGVGLVLWSLMATLRRVERWEGAGLLAVYAVTVPLVA